MKYICLFNPHSQEWLLFDYVEGKEQYAPNYGTALMNGHSPENCINKAVEMWEINPDDVEVA